MKVVGYSQMENGYMSNYDRIAKQELIRWKKKMRKKPSIIERGTSKVQGKFNGILPKKYHEIMTVAIKSMVKTVLFGYKYITKPPYRNMTLEERENLVREKAKVYKKTAMIEGAGTGAGGFFIGLADFPLLLGIKVKLLYDIAAIYGFDVKDYKERIYILNIMQITFSSKEHRKVVFEEIESWNEYIKTLPDDINDFNWTKFQQEYRDYLDLAKLFQLLPVIGAVVGFCVNGNLIEKLTETAIYSYRCRIIK